NGLHDALTNETSPLLEKVKRCRLEVELEKAKQDIVNLKTERDQLKLQAERVLVLQAEIQTQQKIGEQLEAQHRSEISRREKTLQELKSERDIAQQEIGRLQTELVSLQARNTDIQSSMDNLKNSLETIIATQMENSSSVKRQ